MIDPVSVIVVAVTFVAGWLVGRHGRLHKAAAPVRPICECGHHFGDHEGPGHCNAEVVQATWIPSSGYRDLWVPCACLKYTGPVPLDQFWTPPLASSE